MDAIVRLLPEHIKRAVLIHVAGNWDKLEEIRFRLNLPIELNFHQQVEWITDIHFSKEDSIFMLNQLSDHSLYRMEEELREGYITVKGGHRVGLAGEVTTKDGEMGQLKYITFFNIRIAREVHQIAAPFMPFLHDGTMLYNTLIIGPPQTGKTTILRDVARIISDGTAFIPARKVGIIDERSEIAAAIDGVPQHQVGRRTDVMDACPKVTGMMMLIRSMSPDVLIVDEIGKEKEVHALMEAIFAGVHIICTAHGFSMEQLKKRPSFQTLFKEKAFERIVTLHKHTGNRYQVDITDADGNEQMTTSVVKK